MSFPTRRLKNMATVVVSSVDKKSVDGEVPVRLCNYTDVYHADRIIDDGEFMPATATKEQVDRFRLRPGQTLITKDSETAEDIGIAALVESAGPDLVCGYHLAVLTPDEGVADPRFLFWTMRAKSTRSQLAIGASGVTRFGLRAETITGLDVPLPPIECQVRISDLLDTESARIDDLIAAKQKMVELAGERLDALRDAVLWSHGGFQRIGNVVDDRRPVMYGIVLPGPNIDDGPGVPIVKGGDVACQFTRPLNHTTVEIEASFARARLREGDLVLAIRGGIGDVARVPSWAEGSNITQDVARIAPSAMTDPSWLYHVLCSPRFQAQAESFITGATIRGLNIGDIKKLTVPRTPLQDQKRLADRLDREEKRSWELTETLTRQIELLREHRQALITAAVTGELEVA
ncbi:MAG: restriction endonuclease subunit S [Acidimicrobiia bacterium]